MSLSTTRSYFRARLVSLGYKEWDDGFNFENIPENIIDKAFHIENFQTDFESSGNTGLEVRTRVITRVLFKGFRSVKDALDKCDDKVEAIIVEVLKPSNRLSGLDGLRDVRLDSIEKKPIAFSNDNTILVEITWTALINICLL